MIYQVEFKPRALKDLKGLPDTDSVRIVAKVAALQNDLEGDVKRLTHFTPEYRLRVGAHFTFLGSSWPNSSALPSFGLGGSLAEDFGALQG